MNIFNNNISEIANKYEYALRNAITPDQLNNKSNPISSLIHYNDLNSVKQRISDWVASRLMARHVFVPDWTDLIRVYDYVFIDSHVFGIINGIKQKIKGKEFVIYDTNGEINKELTEGLQTRWFSRYTDFFIESFFYPYSLIELGDYVDGKFNDIAMIKREYVVPQYKSVKMYLAGSTVPRYVQHWPQSGVKMTVTDPGSYMLDYFQGDERINDYIFMQCPLHDLGLLDMAAPHALGKMGSLSFYLDYLQKFVVPFRHGKTDLNDPLRRNNMDAMMAAWGASGYAVTDLMDEIGLLENGGTATAPFTDLFTYSNNEISKAFASAVGIFDEKNFVGSAEAGERMLDAIVSAYCKEFEFNVNDELLTRLAIRDKRYVGKSFEYVSKEVIPYAQRIDAIVKLASIYKLDTEEVSEKSDFKIEEKEIPEQLQLPFDKKEEEAQDVKVKKKIKPMPEKMVENAKRALKYAEIKKVNIGSNVKKIADIIINKKLDIVDDEMLRILNEFEEMNEPYSESEMSVRFDLLGGKEGKEWAKKHI